jgi:Family of unknown function (DUF6289)
MRSMNRFPRIAAFAVALVVGAAAYVALLPTNEAIIIAGPKACTYYKDATYKKAIGGFAEGCCGGFTTWGQTSQYIKCQQLLCPDVVCPD